ncbi:MAG: thioredoxin [Clostridia bacterium]|nr:thioredoxin [Clostridia bacterium]
MSDKFVVMNEKNFDEMLESNKYLLVDFWATWCNPCKMLLPIMEEFATDNAGIVTVGKVNVDDSVNLAQRFGVMTIPTVLFFVNGQLKDKFVGFRQKAQISAFVEKNRA